MNGINDWGINQFLQRRLNITDAPAPASTLAPEVMPVVQVMPPSQEDAFLRGERLCAAATAVGALAANYSVVTLFNPVGSGILVLVDDVILNSGSTTFSMLCYLERVQLPTFATQGSGVRDSRWGLATNRSAAVFAAGQTATAPNIAWIYFARPQVVAGLAPSRYNLGCVLTPGTMLLLFPEIVNASQNSTIFWRERPAQPSELG